MNALAKGVPIVEPRYFFDLLSAVETKQSLPGKCTIIHVKMLSENFNSSCNLYDSHFALFLFHLLLNLVSVISAPSDPIFPAVKCVGQF